MAGERIKVAVDARMVENSGIGTILKSTVPRLMALPDMDLVLLGEKEKLERYPWFDPGRFIRLDSRIYSVAEQAELPLRIPTCDVFWSPHFNIPVAPIRARGRLLTLCDTFHLAFYRTLPLSQKVYAKILLNASVRLSDRIVTISEFSAGEIRDRVGVAGGKLQVIPCGCDAAFAQGAAGPQRTRPYLLFVGNVKPNKNLKNALAAFFLIAPSRPDLDFVIVGRKEGFINADPGVAAMAAGGHGARLVFTGHVPDAALKSYYKHATALVFPSLYEGFGLPLLEAMAFGIPVISSDRASLPEVGGDAVLYFDPADPEAIAARMEEVMEGRWRPDPAKYAERLRIFDWDVASSRYAAVIRELAGREEGA